MAKGKTTLFFCQECGYETTKWLGQCPGCKNWNTFVEEIVDKKAVTSSGKLKRERKEIKPLPLSQISSSDEERISTNMSEFDRVLGGGVVKG